MVRTKEMHAGGFYLFVGNSSANSSFIEDKSEAMEFIKACNTKLDGYVTIHDFLLMKDGWQLLVELKDEDSIKSLYKQTREKSRKAKVGNGLNIVWKIISEQLRALLSNFVVYSNKKNGRTGSKVARSYERYWFETVEEAERHLEKMRKQLMRASQRLRKYRPGKNHFRISSKVGKGAIFLCSLHLKKGMEREFFGEGCLDLVFKNLDVLRLLIKKTKSMHSRSKSNEKIDLII